MRGYTAEMILRRWRENLALPRGDARRVHYRLDYLIGPGGLYAEASALAPKPATSSRAEILGWHENKRFFQNGP